MWKVIFLFYIPFLASLVVEKIFALCNMVHVLIIELLNLLIFISEDETKAWKRQRLVALDVQLGSELT